MTAPETPAETSRPHGSGSDLLAAVRAKMPVFRKVGWGLIIVGIVAILFPFASSVAFKALLGWLFLITGAVTLYHAFQARAWRSALMEGAIGVLHLAAGVYLAFFLTTGLIGLTLLMALVFLAQGGFETAIALQHRSQPGWIGLLISGIASLGLGVLLMAGLPGSALWAIGLMMGLNMLTSGLSLLALARAAQNNTQGNAPS